MKKSLTKELDVDSQEEMEKPRTTSTRSTRSRVKMSYSRYFHGSHMDWKIWKLGKHFPVREKSGNFEQTGKVGGFLPKTLEK